MLFLLASEVHALPMKCMYSESSMSKVKSSMVYGCPG